MCRSSYTTQSRSDCDDPAWTPEIREDSLGHKNDAANIRIEETLVAFYRDVGKQGMEFLASVVD